MKRRPKGPYARVNFKHGQLRYFVAVAEEGQMTRAAARLHIAQPALSQAIAALESQIGFALFDRVPRGVVLTPHGRRFLDAARALLDTEEDVSHLAEALARSAHSRLAIGFFGPPPPLHSERLLDDFAERSPEAGISYRDLPFPREGLLEWLADVDAAFAPAPPVARGVWVQPVRRVERLAIVPAGDPLARLDTLTSDQLADATFIGIDEDVAEWVRGPMLLHDALGPRRRTTDEQARSSRDLAAMVAAGRGVIVLPEWEARTLALMAPKTVPLAVTDVEPAELSLIGREDRRGGLVDTLVEAAEDAV